MNSSQKSNKIMMAGTITREKKKGRPEKGQKINNSQKPKKNKKLVLLMVGPPTTLLMLPTCKL